MNDGRLYIRCLLALCALVVAACAPNSKPAGPPPRTVQTALATTRTVQPVRSLSGDTAPLQNVAVTSDLQEPTAAVYVNEGDSVRRGQTLALLSTTDLDANLAQAKAHLEQMHYQATLALQQGNDQVRSAQATLAQAQENLNLAQANLSRDQQLLSQGYIAVQAVDQQRTQVQVDEQTVVSAKAALAQAQENAKANGTPNRGLQQANVDQAAAAVYQIEAQIAKADIVSPIDGVVVNRNLNPGEYPGTRQIFTLQEVSRVYAELNAYGAEVSGIREGTAVTLTSAAVPRRTFAGTVVAVLSPTSPSSNGFIVKVVVPNEDGTLRPGMTVSANVKRPAMSGIAVPATAFVDDTHQTVMIVDGDTAHVANVTEIVEDSRYAIVEGIPAGTRVVANGDAGLSDGEKVAVR